MIRAANLDSLVSYGRTAGPQTRPVGAGLYSLLRYPELAAARARESNQVRPPVVGQMPEAGLAVEEKKVEAPH